MSGDDEPEYRYTEWRCTNCGHGVPKNNPPCDRCGSMELERVEVRESDFAEEVRGPSTVELLRDHWLSVGGGLLVILVVAVAALASAGVFVLSDPVGLGYRFGAVDPVQPDDNGTLTAAELHGRVDAAYEETSLRWSGRDLHLSYRTTATERSEIVAEVTTVATWYATYVGDGGDAARLRVTVESQGSRSRVFVERADAAAFDRGDISREEYQSRIFQSE